MSSIFSELVADVLLGRCAEATESEKYLIGALLGVPPEELYVALVGRADSTCSIQTGADAHWEMRAVELPKGITVIPYLVRNGGVSSDPNQGNRGFNGKLRDWFDRGLTPGEVRVLVTFDSDPVETQKSAMSEALQETLLSPASLLNHLKSEVDESAKATVQPLLRHVLDFVEDRKDLSAAEITRGIHVIRSLASGAATVTDVGERLVELPWLLRDPAIEEGTAASRLKRAETHRVRIDGWAAAPDKDFNDEVRSQYAETVSEQLIASRRLGNVNWEEFTLEELQGGYTGKPEKAEKIRFNPASPASVISSRASTYRLVDDVEGEPRYSVVALISSERAQLIVNLSRPLQDRETLHLVTYEHVSGAYRRAGERRIIRDDTGALTTVAIDVDATPLAGQWFFCEVALTSTATYRKNYLDKIDFGLLISADAELLPFDRACKIDAGAQRFVVEDEPEILTISSDGTTEPAADSMINRHSEEGVDVEDVEVTTGGATVKLPVRFQLDESDEEPAARGEHSAEHAALRFAAHEGLPLSEVEIPRLNLSHGQATITIGGRETPLADLPSLGRSRWRVESEILHRPDLTNYLLRVSGELEEDPALQALGVGEELREPFDRFTSAREEFFNRITEDGVTNPQTVLAVRLNEIPEAAEYIAAYAALLDAIPDGVNWRAEYERLLLMDSVRVEGSNDLHLAPTSPLAVALHSQLQDSITRWSSQEVENLSERDPDAISVRFGLPLVRAGKGWHEAQLAPYPWRSYAPREQVDEEHAEPFLPEFIERRIEAFLKVHPIYRDQRRTLVLAFINPGDGAHIRDALLQIINAAARGTRTKLEDIPQFEVKLFAGHENANPSDIELLGAALDRFMSVTQESGAPGWIEQEMMRRLTYTKARLDEYIADPGAFSHIAFVHNYFRPGTLQSYDLTERASTLYAGGLSPDIERAAEMNPNDITFSSGLWLGPAPRTEPLERIIERSAEVVAAGLGTPVTANRGVGVLTSVPKQTIPALYDRAVWVVHLDRHIGLELFYPQNGGETGSPYILDHTDQENLQESGLDAITATTMVKPYLAVIKSIFAQFVDGMDEVRADRLLRWLNLLSGRWALQLLQERPNDIKERLGAVIAMRMLTEREHLFDTTDALSLVVTLDELLRVTGKEGLALREGWASEFGHSGAASDDLLLLRIPLSKGTPVVYARVIEVKYTEGAPPTEKAWQQLDATQRLLEMMFATSGPGTPFRGRVLAKLIRSYASRFASYGLIDHTIETDPRFADLLGRIGSGDFVFRSRFCRSGKELIGDFISVEPRNDHPLYQAEPYAPETNPERRIGRIRIGGDLIEALVSNNSAEAQAGSYEMPQYGCGESAETEATEPPQPTTADEAMTATTTTTQGTSPPNDSAEAEAEPRIPPDEAAEDAGELEVVGPPLEQSHSEPLPDDEGRAAVRLHDRFAIPEADLLKLADKLDQVFARYALPVQPFSAALADAGPNVIRFRTRMLEAGTIGSIEARSRDIHRELAIDDPIYIGQEPPYIVVDVPRDTRTVITLGDVLPAIAPAAAVPGELPVVMGVNASGDVVVADLAEMPHLLVAGSTGSGKSVFLSTIGACLGTLPVSRVELVVIDIKGLDFAPFRQLPHTRGGAPIEDPEEAIATLKSLMADEVQRRRNIFRTSGARQIIEHYQNAPQATWPKQIVVMIDEYAQLASASGTSRSSLEGLVQQYAQYARAFGIYLVLATQRPSVDVITGRIKANLPARCVFRLPSFNDSRTVIDTGGAEKLLGSGDMLFYREGAIQRLQAVFTAPADFTRIASSQQ